MNALLKKLEQIQDHTYSCSSSFTFIPMDFSQMGEKVVEL